MPTYTTVSTERVEYAGRHMGRWNSEPWLHKDRRCLTFTPIYVLPSIVNGLFFECKVYKTNSDNSVVCGFGFGSFQMHLMLFLSFDGHG